MNEQELLRGLSRRAEAESCPQIDVVGDVLNTINQRQFYDAGERPLLWITGCAMLMTGMITFWALPSWKAINSPWISLLESLPGGLL